VRSKKSCPSELWRSVNELMGRGSSPASLTITAVDFHRFMDDKVAGVRASTDGAASPLHYTTALLGCSLHQQTTDDVVAAVRQLPDKQSATDPMPTRLMKQHVDVLAPFLTALFNRSLSLGVVPTVFKAAYITPRLKKPDLDQSDLVISANFQFNRTVESVEASGIATTSRPRVCPQVAAESPVCLSGTTLN